MSVPQRILCRTGCGDYGDPELAYLCVDCHGDQVEQAAHERMQELLRESAANKKKHKHKDKKSTKQDESKRASEEPDDHTESETTTTTNQSPPRRGPPSINHKAALEAFLARPREQDPGMVERERIFLQREQQIRETSKTQLRKYMIATDEDEPVDPKEWGRYKYGAPRTIPQHDADPQSELQAQMTLYCYWRRRTVHKRVLARQMSPVGGPNTDGSQRLTPSPSKRMSVVAMEKMQALASSPQASSIRKIASRGKDSLQSWRAMSTSDKRASIAHALQQLKQATGLK